MQSAVILFDQRGPFESGEIVSLAETTLSKVRLLSDEIYLHSQDKSFAGRLGIPEVFFSSSFQFLEFLKTSLPGKSVLLLNVYSPLLDVESSRKMLGEHTDNAFDYTYPENIPQGLLPEIIDSDAAAFIQKTIPEAMPLFGKSVREIFERDLSSYDCNIFISPSRIMKYRVQFIPDNQNDFLILKELVEQGLTGLSIMDLEAKIQENPSLIRKRPTYYEIELNTERENGVFFAGNLLKREGVMKIDDLKGILDQIAKFSKNPMVSLGFLGEPLLHPDIAEIPGLLENYPEIRFLLETRGLFFHEEALKKFLELTNVMILFDLSAVNNETFEKHKKSLNTIIPFENISTIEEKIKKLPYPERIYLQFTRSTENEGEIMRFYEKWRDFTDRIVVKKIDCFGGELSKYRVVDLSPVERFACLHLKHDMVIFFDGSVPLCRQDLNGKYRAGSILSDGIEKCWDALDKTYLKHWNKEYQSIPLCEHCDEWWVFNN